MLHKRIEGGAMPENNYPPTPGDTLVFENDRVRVWSMTLEANGGIFDFHQHHHDHLVLWPDAGRAEGQELGDTEWHAKQEAQSGFCMFKTVGSGGPLRPHRIRNLEDHPVTHYIVELISEPSPSVEPLESECNDRGFSYPRMSMPPEAEPPEPH
jgi:hypothetical protein